MQIVHKLTRSFAKIKKNGGDVIKGIRKDHAKLMEGEEIEQEVVNHLPEYLVLRGTSPEGEKYSLLRKL